MSPDLVALLTTFLITAGTALYHKIKGDKAASIADAARDLVDQALHFAIVTADANVDDLRAKATSYAWVGLAKLGVQHSVIADGIVASVVNEGIAEALRLAKEHDRAVVVAMTQAQAQLKASLVGWDEVLAKAVAEGARKLPAPDPTPAPAA